MNIPGPVERPVDDEIEIRATPDDAADRGLAGGPPARAPALEAAKEPPHVG
jgi:hypothetical protein